MIRGKVIFIFLAVIFGTALTVYMLTKEAYDKPIIIPLKKTIAPLPDVQEIIQSAPPPNITPQNQDVDVSFHYAGTEKSHYFGLLEFTLPEGTKTYWKKAGFGGINPELDLSKSKNIRESEIFWGTPKKHTSAGVINYVLDKNPKILIKIIPDKLADPVHLKGSFNYGYCDTQCKAGTKDIDMLINSTTSSDITVANRYDIMKNEPTPLEENKSEIKIFDFKDKIDRNSHIISFTFEAEKPFREENLFYSFDSDDYEIMRPLIQNIYEGRRRITIDMVGLSETPKEIEVIYKKDDGTAIVKHHNLSFERYN